MLLGFSGGRDSVSLLHLLKANGYHVVAAHLNHQLRGRESLADERFVRDLCRTWKVPLVVKRENVAARARRHGLSIEEAARIARYRFLAEVARKRKLRRIVVAHHQRDQAETVLLKIFRGCRRHQLHGMEMRRFLPALNWNKKVFSAQSSLTPNGGETLSPPVHLGAGSQPSALRIQLVRPLLEAPSLEIAHYARQNRLMHREDSSNRDLARPRNWIRHRLLPLIERRLNRNVVKTLARLGA